MGEAGPSGLERGALCCNFWENSKGPGERQNSYPLPLGVTPRAPYRAPTRAPYRGRVGPSRKCGYPVIVRQQSGLML